MGIIRMLEKRKRKTLMDQGEIAVCLSVYLPI